jgi:chemotaxis signal transduction protein
MPVIDLPRLLGTANSGHFRGFVITEDGGRLAGLAVDAVRGVEHISCAGEAVTSPHLNGAAPIDGTLVGLIDLGAVLDCVEREQRR